MAGGSSESAAIIAYDSPEHGFEGVLDYAPDGLVRDYPGIAVRVA